MCYPYDLTSHWTRVIMLFSEPLANSWTLCSSSCSRAVVDLNSIIFPYSLIVTHACTVSGSWFNFCMCYLLSIWIYWYVPGCSAFCFRFHISQVGGSVFLIFRVWHLGLILTPQTVTPPTISVPRLLTLPPWPWPWVWAVPLFLLQLTFASTWAVLGVGPPWTWCRDILLTI